MNYSVLLVFLLIFIVLFMVFIIVTWMKEEDARKDRLHKSVINDYKLDISYLTKLLSHHHIIPLTRDERIKHEKRIIEKERKKRKERERRIAESKRIQRENDEYEAKRRRQNLNHDFDFEDDDMQSDDLTS